MRKHALLFVAAMLTLVAASAQSNWGPSDPTPARDCQGYAWPEIDSPEIGVQIKQKYDHTALPQYRQRGWDTVVTCANQELILSCTPYVPVFYYNGHYTVDTIPYNPPVPDFHSGLTQMPLGTDDQFNPLQQLPPDFSFYFFGKKKTSFCVGGNGMISFNPAAASQMCAYGTFANLPWPDGTQWGGNSGILALHRDAIYGIFQDLDPRGCTGNHGMYYGIVGDMGRRKIVASFNDVPWFMYSDPGNDSNLQSYQIVCYEGTNMIEVHVKRRTNSTATFNWVHNGVLGIQDSLGTLQMPNPNDPLTMLIPSSGAPAAYYPATTTGGNVGTQSIIEKAYRFTPHGHSLMNYGWYRITDGNPAHNDTLLTQANDDGVHSYYEPMQGDLSSMAWDDCPCASLTKAHIRNVTEPTQYVFFLKFYTPEMVWYNLVDTITVGVDNGYEMNLHAQDAPATIRQKDIFAGHEANLVLEYPALQEEQNKIWSLRRVNGGEETPLPNYLLTLDTLTVDSAIATKTQQVSLTGALPTDGLPANKIDSVYVQVNIDFVNGCAGSSNFLVRLFPNADTVYVHDTTYVEVHDTTYIDVHDTLYIHDTVYIHDTIVSSVGEVDALNAKIYVHNGQIVVEGAEDNAVMLYDVSGRQLAIRRSEEVHVGVPLKFNVPISGAYMVKIGNHPARRVVVIL